MVYFYCTKDASSSSADWMDVFNFSIVGLEGHFEAHPVRKQLASLQSWADWTLHFRYCPDLMLKKSLTVELPRCTPTMLPRSQGS